MTQTSKMLGAIGVLMLLAAATSQSTLLIDTCTGTALSQSPQTLSCSGSCDDDQAPCIERSRSLGSVGTVYYCGCTADNFPPCCFLYRRADNNHLGVSGQCQIGQCPSPPVCKLMGTAEPAYPYQAACVNP